MRVCRALRTIRYLSAEQILYRGICRGRFEIARRWPGTYRGHIEAVARRLLQPDWSTDAAQAAARHVLTHQSAVHAGRLGDFERGRFHFLGRAVDFGSLGAIEWRRDLGEGNNPLWRMNLSYFGWAVPMLGAGGCGRLDQIAQVLDGLEVQNPWSVPGVFRDVWHPYSASHRLINLAAGLSLHRAAGGPVERVAEAAITGHVKLCTAFLLRNLEWDLQYNHLLKNLVALAFYRNALTARCRELDFLPRAVESALKQQILPDGGHAERSPMYHTLCIHDLELLRLAGFKIDGELAAMKAALVVMSHPDGDIALFNDSWLGECPPQSAPAAGDPGGMSCLPDTGYVRLAGGGDAVIFDRGPCGPDDNPGHAHADFLSVELSVGGRRFVVDPGVATYSAGPLRDMCRSSSQHNGPHMIGSEPIEFWKSFRVGRRGRAYPLDGVPFASIAPLWAAGWQDGYRCSRGVLIYRWIGLWPGSALLLVDVWRGTRDHKPGLRFLVPGTWRACAGNIFERDGRRVAAHAMIGEALPAASASWWPCFGVEEAAHAVSVRPATTSYGSAAATLFQWGAAAPIVSHSAEALADALAKSCHGH